MSSQLTHPNRAVLLEMAVFFLQPVVFGGWLTLIPRVQAALELSKADLAFALLGMPVGLILGLKIAGNVISRLGPRRILMLAFPAQALAFAPIGLAPNWASLTAALFLVGCVVGFMQISLNVGAGRLEKALGRMIMSRCHGFWALGVMAGSLLMSRLPDMPVVAALSVVGWTIAALGIAVAWALPHLGAAIGTPPPPRRTFGQLPIRLLLICGFVLPVALTEGAMADWAAVFLAESLGPEARAVGMGVTLYSGCLALGRFAGDWMRARLGMVALARLTMGLALVGVALLVAPVPVWASLTAFGLVGLGVSVGFPLAVSAAALLDDEYEGQNVGLMSMVALSSFLIGPPMIGLIAEAASLRVGLAALIPFTLLSLALAGALKGQRAV